MKYAISEILKTSVPLVSLIRELDDENLIYEALLSGKIKTADQTKIEEFIIERFKYPFNTLRFLNGDVLKKTVSSLLYLEDDTEEYDHLIYRLKSSLTFICLFIGEFCSKTYVSTVCRSLKDIIRLYLNKYTDVDFYTFILWDMFMGYIKADKDNTRIFAERYFLNEIGDVFDIKGGQELQYLNRVNSLSDKGLLNYIKKNLNSVLSVNIEKHDFSNIDISSNEKIRELITEVKIHENDDELSEESFFAMMDLEDSVIFEIVYLLDYLYVFEFLYEKEYSEEHCISLLMDYLYEAVSFYTENTNEFLSDNSDFYSFVGWYALTKLLRGF